MNKLQTLVEIGKSVTSRLDLEEVLRLVVKAAVDLTGADKSYLLLIDDTSGNLYLRAEVHLGVAETKDFWVRMTDSIAGQVVETGEPVIISTEENADLRGETNLAVYSLINVPVKVSQKVIGVLGADNHHQQRAFTVEDQTLLAALADWAAIAIQNASLYTATTTLSRNLELVNDVSRLISSTLDIEQIPRLLVQRTTELVGAECGSLALLDQERGGVIFQVAYDGQGQEIKGLKDFLMPLGRGIVGLAAQTGIPHIVNNVQEHPGWSPVADQLTGFTTKKIIAIPLIVEGEILGVIELLNKKRGDFGEEDVRLLSLVASSAAIAIQNARQYVAIKRAHEALQQVQEQRIASERWAVLGQAAGNLAHRINNSTALVPIAAQHLQALLQQVSMPAELRREVNDHIERIKRNTLYTVDLAMALLRRFRQDPARAHDVNKLVERALALVEIPKNIKVVCHLDPALPAVDTPDLLVDAFVELIMNARQVMETNGGLLRIATFKIGTKVSIQITDSGSGIAEGDLERVFEMFYTTNPQGLGFGLWWVKTFLEQQQGEITVESRLNEGTTFTISLPGNSAPLPSL